MYVYSVGSDVILYGAHAFSRSGSSSNLQHSTGNSSVMMNVSSGTIKVDPDAPTMKRKRDDDDGDTGQ